MKAFKFENLVEGPGLALYDIAEKGFDGYCAFGNGFAMTVLSYTDFCVAFFEVKSLEVSRSLGASLGIT